MQYEDALIALLSRENGTMTLLVEEVEGKLIRMPGGMYKVYSIVDHTYTKKIMPTKRTESMPKAFHGRHGLSF